MAAAAAEDEAIPVAETYTAEHQELICAYAANQNVFLTGSPGTGKSWSISDLLQLHSRKKRFAFTASTGLASRLANIAGTTIHEWGGLFTGEYPLNKTLGMLSRRKDKYALVKRNYTQTDTLFIDEISMLSLETLNLLNAMAQYFRKDRRPMGGIQLVLSGDFMQIPPVDPKNTIANLLKQIRYERRHIATLLKTFNIPGIYDPIIQLITSYHHFDVSKPEIRACYLFLSSLWQSLDLHPIVLKKQFRQSGDPEYQSVLQRIRDNSITWNDHQFFLSKDLSKRLNPETKQYELDPDFNVYDHFTDGGGFTIPFLHAHRKFVHEYNYKMMQLRCATQGHQKHSIARQVYHHRRGHATKVNIQDNNEISNMARKLCAMRQEPDVLELMVGAPVIVLKRLGIGMKNGTRARVTEIEEAKRRVQIQAEDGELAWVTDCIQSIEIPSEDGKSDQTLKIAQLPITLAFALTIHKSQGQTLSAAVVSLGETTENAGQAYVACSRVKSSDNLYVVNYQFDSFVSDPVVLDFYRYVP